MKLKRILMVTVATCLVGAAWTAEAADQTPPASQNPATSGSVATSQGLTADGGPARLAALRNEPFPRAAAETIVPGLLAEPGSDRIELHVRDADLSAVLKILNEQQSERNKVNFVAGKDLTGKVTADLYGVTLDQALAAVLEMNGYGYRRTDSFIYIYTKKQLADLVLSEAKVETRVFRLNYINTDEAKEVVKPALSKTGLVAVTSRSQKGIPSGGDDVGGDSYSQQDVLVVSDLEANLKRVAEIIKQVDVRPKQVLVEATILDVQLSDDTSLGVDLNVLAGINFDGTSTASFPITNPQGVIPLPVTGTGTVASAPTVPSSKMPFGRVGTTGFATPGQGFQVGVITNNVSMFIQALETISDINVRANPKVLALNKQRAEVMVGSRLGYQTTTTTQTTTVQTVQFLDTGTQLQFRPFISDDGTIRMEIHPAVSTGQISTLGLPSEQTTEVTCNVMVRDGHTIVIGGLFADTSDMNKAQVPGLGMLPVVGALFRYDHSSTQRREIIVLLTPHVVDDGVAEAEGRRIAAEVDRISTGLKARFPIYTREKLTTMHLSEAEKYYDRYLETGSAADRNLTLWNLKLARNVAPNNMAVGRLLDKLETEECAARPRLQTEDVLWERLRQSGLLDNLPPSPVAKSKVEKVPAKEAAPAQGK
jgi:type IV pilus assembly protein PilQ